MKKLTGRREKGVRAEASVAAAVAASLPAAAGWQVPCGAGRSARREVASYTTGSGARRAADGVLRATARETLSPLCPL